MSIEQGQTRATAAPKIKTRGPRLFFKKMMLGTVRILPGGRSTVEPFLRRQRLRLRRWVWGLKYDSAQAVAGNNLIVVDPATIEFCAQSEFAYREYMGRKESGDWDISEKRFDNLSLYKAFEEVCKLKTKTWQETDYYKDQVQQIESGREKYYCKTREEFDARCVKLSALYNSINKDGYKSQAELQNNLIDEVAVAIGRDGQILFSDGAHRLSIAKLVGIAEIPALVAVRHSKWAAFKGQLTEFAKTQTLGGLYQQALHPDLLSVPASHGCSDRFVEIEKHLPATPPGKVLDIGCNLGYMLHKFEDKGFDCIGIEIDETHLYILEKLRTAAGKQFEIRSGSFLDDMEVTNHQFEVVIALNIFHHFLKVEADYRKLIAFLKRTKTNYMVFEPHLPSEPQMQTAFKNYSADEFCAFIMEHTGLRNKKENLSGARW